MSEDGGNDLQLGGPTAPEDASRVLGTHLGDLVVVFPNGRPPIAGTLNAVEVITVDGEAVLELRLDPGCGVKRFSPGERRIQLTGDEWCWPIAPVLVRPLSDVEPILIGVAG